MNDVQKYAVIVEGVEIISNLLARNDIYATLYLIRTANGVEEMRRCIVELYASILVFLAKATRYYSEYTQ